MHYGYAQAYYVVANTYFSIVFQHKYIMLYAVQFSVLCTTQVYYVVKHIVCLTYVHTVLVLYDLCTYSVSVV